MISVIVICHNERHAIHAVMEGLSQQLPPEQEYEVIVACNRSTDDTELLLESYPVMKLLLRENYYTAALHNAAVTVARGDILFFIDGHMLLAPDALRNVEDALRDPALAGVCGYYTSPDGSVPFLEAIRDLRYHAKGRKARCRERQIINLDNFFTLTGGLFAVRRAIFEAVGGYDITFQRDACEDIFVAIKILNTGHILAYDPNIRARHFHLHSSLRSFLVRGAVWEPRGLARLIQRSVDGSYRLPFDNYVIQVPLHTTGLFIVSGLWAALVSHRGKWLFRIGVASQVLEVLPFFTACPGQFALHVRLAAAVYWIYVNLFRIVFCTLGWIRRFAPYTSGLLVSGELRAMGGEVPTLYERQFVVTYERRPWRRYWASLVRIYTFLYADAIRHLPRWLCETLIVVKQPQERE